jgi:plastocyanin
LRRTGCLLAAAALVVGACGDSEDSSGSAAPPSADAPPAFSKAEATTALDVQAVDYAFTGLPPSVQGPNVYFTVANKGHTEHELEIVGADGEPVAEIAPFAANTTESLAVKLAPGAYTVQCVIKEGAKTHAELGMKSALTVS